MRILITGSTGFIGTKLVDFYRARQHDTYTFSRKHDVTITECLDFVVPDVIINCAGEIYDETKMVGTNILMVDEILRWMIEHPQTELIHLGSSSEYGKVKRATCEDDKIDPVDLYSATKGAGTLLCQGYARKYDMKISIVRPYSVYGPNDRKFKLFHRLWKCFVDPTEGMELYDGVHDWIYVDDFINGIELIRQSKQEKKGDIIGLGTGIMTSNFRIFDIFCKEFGAVPENVKCMHSAYMKTYDSQVWLADITKANDKYNFRPSVTIEDGIKIIKQLETHD